MFKPVGKNTVISHVLIHVCIFTIIDWPQFLGHSHWISPQVPEELLDGVSSPNLAFLAILQWPLGEIHCYWGYENMQKLKLQSLIVYIHVNMY